MTTRWQARGCSISSLAPGPWGVEAVSRGAAFALLVDNGAEARGVIRANVDALGAAGLTRIFRRDATRLGPAKPLEPFSLVFCDPPYGKGLGERALASARDGGWLAPDALVVLEEASSSPVVPPEGFRLLEERLYGDSKVLVLRFDTGG